ncbi:hypothetical protein V2J09_014813 [Rumex salicifolius]
MELQAPCSVCSPLHQKPAILRRFFRPLQFSGRTSSTRFRRLVTSELKAVELSGGNGGVSYAPVQSHKVIVHDRERGVTHEFFVPEDQYILHTAEDQDIRLPFACRHVYVMILTEEKANAVQGYALLCVGFPTSDIEVETQDEDEVYWLQFGRYFARGPIERDDYALELAMGDE